MYYPGEACTLSKVSESSLRPLQGLTLHQLQALNTASSNCSDLSPEYTDPGHVLRGNSHKETTKPVTRGETADTSRQDRSHAQKVESSGGHGVVVQRMCSASGPGGSDGTGRARTAGQEAKGRTPTPDCRQRHHGFQRHKHKGRPYSRHNMLGVLSVDQKTLHKRFASLGLQVLCCYFLLFSILEKVTLGVWVKGLLIPTIIFKHNLSEMIWTNLGLVLGPLLRAEQKSLNIYIIN